MAVRGDDPLKIQQRAGYSMFSTTQHYIREAEAVREGFGQTFPETPADLIGPMGRFGRGLDQIQTLTRGAITIQPETSCAGRI
jgi:hypothetical protein